MDLKIKVLQARRQANLSQQALGKIIGVSDKAVSSYEVGRSAPPLKILKKIGKATDQPLSFFLQADEIATTDLVIAKLDEVKKELQTLREELQKNKPVKFSSFG